MKVLVLGASKGTGALCVKSALAKGHTVSAFARTPAKLTLTDPKLTKVTGDFHEAWIIRPNLDGLSIAASNDRVPLRDWGFCVRGWWAP